MDDRTVHPWRKRVLAWAALLGCCLAAIGLTVCVQDSPAPSLGQFTLTEDVPADERASRERALTEFAGRVEASPWLKVLATVEWQGSGWGCREAAEIAGLSAEVRRSLLVQADAAEAGAALVVAGRSAWSPVTNHDLLYGKHGASVMAWIRGIRRDGLKAPLPDSEGGRPRSLRTLLGLVVEHARDDLAWMREAVDGMRPAKNLARPRSLVNLSAQAEEWYGTAKPVSALLGAASASLDAGRCDAALDDALRALDLVEQITRSSGGTLVIVFGSRLRADIGDVLREIIESKDCSPEVLDRLVTELAVRDDGDDALVRSLCVDVQEAVRLVDAMAPKIPGSSSGLTGFCLRRFLFKPNRTKQLFVDEYAPALACVGKPITEWSFSTAGEDALATAGSWSPNAVGLGIVGILLTHMPPILWRHAEGRFRLRAEAIAAAITAYERRRGELPETLAALVPAIWDAVPVDPYDHGSIRYDRNLRLIYSQVVFDADVSLHTAMRFVRGF